jgi:hypothetical protein
MPATLTSGGINFNDGTSATKRADFFAPSGTVCLFYRSTAPTFWTQVTTQNDKMLRIVNIGGGQGGSAGGTNAFSNTFTNRTANATVPVSVTGLAVNPTTLDENTIPNHQHSINLGGNTGSGGASPAAGSVALVQPGTVTGPQGTTGAHNHPANITSASGPWSASVDMRLQYIDVILCSFDG